MAWCQENTSSNVDIKDFKDSWRNGIGFCSIVDSLVPGHIDVSYLSEADGAQNLMLAASVAEEHLGIPCLFTPEDLEEGKIDEQTIMNYVCMLVSASNSKKKAVSAEEAKRQREVAELESRMKEDNERYESLKGDLDSMKQKHEEQIEAEAALKQDVEELRKVMKEERAQFISQLERVHAELETDRSRLEEARSTNASLRNTISEKDDELAEAQQQVYSMHLENEDLNGQLKTLSEELRSAREQLRALVKRGPRGSMVNVLSDNIVNQSLYVLMEGMPEISGAMEKKRPGNKFFGKGWKKRHFVLKADEFVYFEKENGKNAKGVIDLRYFKHIEYGQEAKAESKENTTCKFSLVPTDYGVYQKKLRQVDLRCENDEEATKWVDALNKRVDLLSYIHELTNRNMRGCREVVDFVTSTGEDSTELRIEGSVSDGLLLALEKFKYVSHLLCVECVVCVVLLCHHSGRTLGVCFQLTFLSTYWARYTRLLTPSVESSPSSSSFFLFLCPSSSLNRSLWDARTSQPSS